MKKILLVLTVLLGVSYASAASCIDLKSGLSRGMETPNVLILQNFLYEKGFLKAKPNGYFGVLTFSKEYDNIYLLTLYQARALILWNITINGTACHQTQIRLKKRLRTSGLWAGKLLTKEQVYELRIKPESF
jgi:hypothetical protein